ncbi:hypothetical protein MSG28_009421 [Choristoneura fumiferana]|uniref:Uncharacterized protein n=1 Tax=Choristoneura fumiferana TaxID=7141 RepID=A0ACC0KY05_CHOFU|nr:hypothetical protein MSG28_009421 [Choristoneura fumiferana]
MTPKCYMGTIDLKDAYFLLGIHPKYKKYLRFMWKSDIYEFQVLPFGLNTAPYVFTKLLRPVMQNLRSNGHMLSYYLDDIYIVGRSYDECLNSIHATLQTVTTLGFIVNYEKSSLIPQTSVQYLGFILDSENYHLSLPDKKKTKIKQEINLFLKLSTCKIRDFAHLTGLLVSACPATEYGWLYTKDLERQKYIYLKQNSGDYDKIMPVSVAVKNDLTWWSRKIDKANSKIKCNNFCKEVYSDASLTGWGGSCEMETAAGLWNDEEKKNHINYLELLAAFLSLKTFCFNLSDCEILLRIDNTTAISYINRMGGVQFPHLNSITRQIWKFCEDRKLIIFASYIKSELNVIADKESRKSHSEIECELSDNFFQDILHSFGLPDVDLFASRANAKCKRYVSWKGDPDAFQIDAFTLSWKPYFFYAFPPFSLISKMLQKIISEQSEGIVVVPKWHAQAWYPQPAVSRTSYPGCRGAVREALSLRGVSSAAADIMLASLSHNKPEICPGQALLAYMDKTKAIRNNCDQLLIAFKKPHKQITSQTISRWIKLTLNKSGIDTSIFTAHSTRHASTSAANRLGVNIDTIRKTAGQVTIKLLDSEGKLTSAAPKVSSHELMSCSESRAVPSAWYCFRSHKLYGIVLGASTSRACD